MRALVLAGALVATACLPGLAADRPQSAGLAAGERAFQRCYACHALSPETAGADGPHLAALVGRPVAAVPGYPYSTALQAYARNNPSWTTERLDAFLTDPEKEVPGNAMGFFGMDDPAERAALIAWLGRRS